MKILIVFLSLLVLCLNLLIYSSDYKSYKMYDEKLKDLAAECARGATLHFDIVEYGEGNLIIDMQTATAYVNKKVSEMENVKGKVAFFPEDAPNEVKVNLEYKGKDFFRLPFIKKDQIKKSASYIMEGRGIV